MHDEVSGSKALSVFSHLNAEKAGYYRCILGAFMSAKAAFALHLRPSDVRIPLAVQAVLDETDTGAVDAALLQLCEWGNLEAHRDTAEVATVEEFYRPRFLYQLTPEGEAAERAIAVFFEALGAPGELQVVALADIRQYLGELANICANPIRDESVAHRVLQLLTTRFEQLTGRAQAFLRSLQRTIDLHGISVDTFLAYKQTLIDYLERFISELVVSTHEIAERLEEIDRCGIDGMLDAVAQRETIDVLDHERPARLAQTQELWRARWAGLRAWFIQGSGRPSQAETLRTRARSAIPALLNAVARINDRRVTRSDRVADLQTLAYWFAEAKSDGEAHRLWRAAFGLAPGRHLRVDSDTLDEREQRPVPPQTSWLDADPVLLSPRIRQSGRHVPKGLAKGVIDRRKEKELLARLDQQEAQQIALAQSRLASGKRLRLSEFQVLETPAELDLFLDLLGEALASKVHAKETAIAWSSDGALRIELEPIDDGSCAIITTSLGEISGEDHFITISDAFAEKTDNPDSYERVS
jgi:uncharacterized protein (TIGR02677 family)